MDEEKAVITMWLLDNETHPETAKMFICHLTDGEAYTLCTAIQTCLGRQNDFLRSLTALHQ